MTVKELIDRLNEFNCPDYEVQLVDGLPINNVDVRFSDVGNRISIGSSKNIKRLSELVETLRSYTYDFDNILDDMVDTIETIAELT